MSGLDNPRGLAFGPEGALYVAEAGRGPADPSCFADPNQPQCTCHAFARPMGLLTICWGPTGAVSRLWRGEQERVVEGLPSWSLANGRSEGPNGVSMLGPGEGYVTIGIEASPTPLDEARSVLGPGFGALVHFFGPSGEWRSVADLVEYEKRANPDEQLYVQYGDVNFRDHVDSNPFGVLAEPGGVVVVDAGGNDVLRVAANGDVSTLAVLPPVPQASDHNPVPTSVAVGPDGAYYVGQLTGSPFVNGAATIYRLVPGSAPEPFRTGFKAVIGVAFDPAGNLYVLQHATGATGFNAPGVVIRVAPDGTRTTLMMGLDRPTGIAVGPDGAVYVTNHGLTPGMGEVLRLEAAAAQSGPGIASGILGPGSKIAFNGDREGRDAPDEIYVISAADGTGERRVTPTTHACNAIFPRWSPDGHRIAFGCSTDSPPFAEIYLVNADGAGMTQLTNMTAAGLGAGSPSWSPDGKRIVFQSSLTPNAYVLDVGDGTVTQLTHAGASRPDLSPDGRKLLFNRSATQLNTTTTQIFVADVDDADGTALQLTFNSSAQPKAANQNARWSPDGQRITFESTRDGNREIYVMNADGSGQTRLTTFPGIDAFPSFSPDGHWIVFHRQLCTIPNQQPPNGSDLFAVAADGSEEVQLTTRACPDGSFSAFASWAPGHDEAGGAP